MHSGQCLQTQVRLALASPTLAGRIPFKKLTGTTVRIGGVVITVAIGTGMVGAVEVGGIVATAGMARAGVAIVVGAVAVIGMIGAEAIATNEYDAANEGRLFGCPFGVRAYSHSSTSKQSQQ